MSLRLNGSTSGYVEIDAPAVAGTTSITIPATTGELAVKATDGSVDLGGVNLDASGRLLVGTSSASATGTLNLQGNSASSTGAAHLRMNLGGSPGASDALGYMIFGDSSDNPAAYIQANRDGGTWTSGSSHPGRLVFSTTANGASSPTERVRIDSSGNFWVYSSDPVKAAALWHRNGLSIVNRETATSNDYILDVRAGSVNQFRFRANGSLYAVNTTIQALTSERRLKENIVPIDSAVAWNTIKSTPFYSYNFKGSSPESVCYGPMADEVPDEMRVDTGNLDDVGPIHTYDNGMLQARLYVALQTALERIETLEGMVALNNMTIAEYQHQLSSLSARLTALEGGS